MRTGLTPCFFVFFFVIFHFFVRFFRGKQVIGVARTCHLILIVLDAMKPLTHRKMIEYELEGFGIRLNKEKPNINVSVDLVCWVVGLWGFGKLLENVL